MKVNLRETDVLALNEVRSKHFICVEIEPVPDVGKFTLAGTAREWYYVDGKPGGIYRLSETGNSACRTYRAYNTFFDLMEELSTNSRVIEVHAFDTWSEMARFLLKVKEEE